MKLLKILAISMFLMGVTQGAEQAAVSQSDDLDALLSAAAQDVLKSEGYFDSASHAAKKREKERQFLAQQRAQQAAQEKAHNDYKELCTACSSGSLERVKALVSAGVGLRAPSESSLKPLCYAIRSDSVETVQFLIDNGADVNEPWSWYTAIQVNKLPMVKLLVLNKADLTKTVWNHRNITLLMWAINTMRLNNTDDEIIRYLLSQGADITQVVPLFDHDTGKDKDSTVYDYITPSNGYIDLLTPIQREKVKEILDKHREDGYLKLMDNLPRFSEDLVKITAKYAGFLR